MPYKIITQEEMEKNMYKKQTPEERLLMLATYGKNTIELKRVLDKGANVNFRNKPGESILYRSVMSGNPEFVKMLLAKGANPNIRCNPTKSRPYLKECDVHASPLDACVWQIERLEQLKIDEAKGYEEAQKYMTEKKCLIPTKDPQVIDGTLKFCPLWYLPKYYEIKEILEKAGAKHGQEVTTEDEVIKEKGFFG